jgi:uncharacterized protein
MTNEDLDRLKDKIIETTAFPTVYMFKFIVKTDNRKIAMVENLFDENAEVHTKESGSGKYISITSRQVAMNVDEIIEVYRRASIIEGIMFL